MSLDALATCDALRAAADELVRIWRAARAESRPGVAPGLLDGVIRDFLARAADGLEAGATDPAGPWARTAGLVRIAAGDRRRSAGELEAEWTILRSILDSVSTSLDVEPGARAFLEGAVAAAQADAPALAEGRSHPEGVAVAVQLGERGAGRRRR